MKLLDSRSTKEIDAHGWSERNVVVLYRQLIGAVKRRCSPECVKFFAMPEVGTDDQLDFYADDFTNASRYKDLKADAREALDRKLVPIVAEIEAFRKELSESARPNDRNLATVLDSVFSVPGHDSIWRVDGEPVVTFWGSGAGGTALDLRSIALPAPIIDDEDDRRRKIGFFRRFRWLLLLLLLLLGLLAFLFGPKLACDLGWRSCYDPVANDDAATLHLQQPYVDINITANDVEPDGDPLVLVACDPPGQPLDTNTARYMRDPSETAEFVTFMCEVADPEGNSASAQVTVQIIAPVNEPPRANPDQFDLPLGQDSVTLDLLRNDTDEDPSTLKIASCDAPSVGTITVSGRSAEFSYKRDSAVEALSASAVCEIVDSEGLTDRATVTINIEPRSNAAPKSALLKVTLPPKAPHVDVDILAAVVDPDGDAVRLAGCAAPGVLYGTGARYERRTGAGFIDRFSCQVTDARGASSTVNVEVTIESEIAVCEPLIVNAPVRIMIGFDVSRSMGDGKSHTSLGRAMAAIQQIATEAPKQAVVTVNGMQTDVTSGPNIVTGPAGIRAYLKNMPDPRQGIRRGGPMFEPYYQWLSKTLRAEDGKYAYTVVVTITDANDPLPNPKTDLIPAFKAHRAPMEHVVILMPPKPDADKEKSYEDVSWPAGGGNFHVLRGATGVKSLTQSILQAARITRREGCEE